MDGRPFIERSQCPTTATRRRGHVLLCRPRLPISVFWRIGFYLVRPIWTCYLTHGSNLTGAAGRIFAALIFRSRCGTWCSLGRRRLGRAVLHWTSFWWRLLVRSPARPNAYRPASLGNVLLPISLMFVILVVHFRFILFSIYITRLLSSS